VPICGATVALDDSQLGGIKQKRFQMFLKKQSLHSKIFKRRLFQVMGAE